MKLNALRVFVHDIDSARHFYGSTIGLRQIWDYETTTGYDVGATLIVEQDKDDEEGLVGRFVGCSLQVEDIDAEYDRLSAAGVRFHGVPERQFWGGTLAHFCDPDGNVLTLLGSAR